MAKIDLKEVLSKTHYNIENESVPLKSWRKEFGIPLSFKVEKVTKYITSHKKKVPIFKMSLWGKIESLDSFKKRIRGRCPKLWTRNKLKFDYKIINDYVWIRVISSWKYNGVIHPKRFFIKDNHLRFKLKDEIGVWYKSGDGLVRYFIIPSKLKLNSDFFQLFGILNGEMTEKKNLNGGTSLRITNSEPDIIKYLIKVFKIFNIKEEDWRISITFNSKGKAISNYGKENIRLFWSKKLNIPLENVGNVTLEKKYISKFSKYGIVQLRYNNQLFWRIIMNLLSFSKKLIFKNRTFAISYLKGLMAAEGGCGLQKNGKLNHVSIGATKIKNQIFYMKILNFLGVKGYRAYKLRIEMYALKNFKLLNKWKIFDLHPYRKLTFNNSFDKLKTYYGIKYIPPNPSDFRLEKAKTPF